VLGIGGIAPEVARAFGRHEACWSSDDE
jgi:hypothetical protein